MNPDKICSHHVGGRSGTRAFPVLPRFESDLINVLYDADVECAAQMEAVLKGGKAETKVLPYCLGAKNGRAFFNIGYDPYTSSLLSPHPGKSQWYFYYRDYAHDYILGETFKPMRREQVQVVTLDYLLRRKAVVPPDVLSIDVQGAEWEVLQGSQKTLKNNTLAVIAEVEFHELYKNQKLFGDVSAFLAKRGFRFVKFTKYFTEFSPYRYPVGLRGDGFMTSSDALFIKDISLVAGEKDSTVRARMLAKLAFIAIVFNQFEYALECLRIMPKKENTGNLAYQVFIQKFRALAKKVPQAYPPTFKDQFTFAESRARFNTDDSDAPKKRKVRKIAGEKYPDSPLEKLCRAYGLHSQADVLKRCRLMQKY